MTTSPTDTLTKLLTEHRSKQKLNPLRPRMPGIYNEADYTPLTQPGAVIAFQALATTLEPIERAQFALSLSRKLPKDAALQLTLGLTFADVAERQPWTKAYMLLNSVHMHIHPTQPMHAVVVDQLKKLEARSDEQSKPAVTHMLKTMPGAPYPDV